MNHCVHMKGSSSDLVETSPSFTFLALEIADFHCTRPAARCQHLLFVGESQCSDRTRLALRGLETDEFDSNAYERFSPAAKSFDRRDRYGWCYLHCPSQVTCPTDDRM